MNKKEQQKAQRAREEDIVLTKVLWWILGAVVLEALLLLLNKVYVNFTTEQVYIAVALQGMFNVLSIVLPICFVVLLIWTLVFWRAGRSLCLPGVLTGISLVLAVCAVVIHYFYDKGINFLYIAVPAVAVLALIYYLYQREFFFAAVLGALGLLGVKVAAQAASSPLVGYGYLSVLAVIVVVAAVCFRMLQVHKGVWNIKGKSKEILPKNANYAMLYVTCALVAVVVIAACVLGALALLYGVLVAWLLILAVYYTVRLM